MNFTCPSKIYSGSNIKKNQTVNLKFLSEENECGNSKYENLHFGKRGKISKRMTRPSKFIITDKNNKLSTKFKFVLNNVLPHALGVLCILLISFFDLILPCDFLFWSQAFRFMFETFFDVDFYPFFVYHMLFPYIFENMRNKLIEG